ncbi:MAG: L-lactate permease [Chitinophagaceae bacterium]
MDIFLSTIPVFVLILLLGVFRVTSYLSSLIALVICLVLAVLYFHFPLQDFFQSMAFGSIKAFGLIIFIIIMAIFGYNILLYTKYMKVLESQISSISKNKIIQVLLITFGFGGLLESLAGFGTSVAIPMAILIGIGYKPMVAAMVSLIANSANTAFGSIGLVIVTLSQETGISEKALGLTIVWQLLALMIVTIFMVTMIINHKAIWQNIILAISLGIVSFVSQYFSALFLSVEVPGIISCIFVLLTLMVIAKVFYKKESFKVHYKNKHILKAWSIYIIIVGLIIVTSPFKITLKYFLENLAHNQFEFMIGGRLAVFEIWWFTYTPFLLLLGGLIGGLIQGARLKTLSIILGKTCLQMKKTVLTTLFLVIFATIMDFSGMIQILANALASSTQHYFSFIAPFIGCIGTFLTGSNAASNILFAKLQYSVAHNLHLDTTWITSANTAGATVGKIISPQSISVATSTCKLDGQEGKILKSVILYALICLLLLSLIIFLF